MSHLDSFAALDTKLHHKTSRKPVPSRKLANNTYAQRRTDDSIAIRLHSTDVVTHHRNGDIVLNSGGWITVTTKARMNAFVPLPIRISSNRGRWTVTTASVLHEADPNHWYSAPDFANALPFADGMTLSPVPGGYAIEAYSVVGHASPELVYAQNAHNTQIERLIDGYLRSVTVAKHQQRMIVGSYDGIKCGMCLPSPVGFVGEVMGDTQHLIQHLIDREVPFSLWMHASALRNPSGLRVGHLDMLKSDLRRYLRSQLLIGPISRRASRQERTRDLVTA